MKGAYRIATIRGVPIRIHFSFLLILPFLGLLFGRVFKMAAQAAGVPPEQLSGPPWVWGLGLAVALFCAVLVHELAHSLYAIRKGGRVSDITLLMIGGVSRITEMPKKWAHEAWMALAGPLTSLALGGLFLGIHYAMGNVQSFNLRFAFFYLGQLNLFLGVFNLLPAFPMDGGRILRSLLVPRLGRVRSTQVAGMVGKGFAVLFGLYGLLSFNVILILIAFFVYMGADAESRQVSMEEALGQLHVRELMDSRTSSVEADTPVDTLTVRMREEGRLAFPVTDAFGRVLGVVTSSAIKGVPAAQRATVTAATIAQPVEPLSPEDTVWKAMSEMSRRQLPQLPVVEAGQLAGTLSQRQVLRLLELRELEGAPRRGRSTAPRREQTHP